MKMFEEEHLRVFLFFWLRVLMVVRNHTFPSGEAIFADGSWWGEREAGPYGCCCRCVQSLP